MGKKKNMNNFEGTMPMPLPLPPLLRSLMASLFNSAADNNSFLSFSLNYKLLQTLRFILLSFYLFLLSFIPAFFFIDKYDAVKLKLKPQKYAHDTRNDTAIGRALSQLLSVLNDIGGARKDLAAVTKLAVGGARKDLAAVATEELDSLSGFGFHHSFMLLINLLPWIQDGIGDKQLSESIREMAHRQKISSLSTYSPKS